MHLEERRPRRQRPVALARKLASCCRSRFVVAKGERPEGTQGMSKPKVCERRAARSDASHERIVRFAKVRLSILLSLFGC